MAKLRRPFLLVSSAVLLLLVILSLVAAIEMRKPFAAILHADVTQSKVHGTNEEVDVDTNMTVAEFEKEKGKHEDQIGRTFTLTSVAFGTASTASTSAPTPQPNSNMDEAHGSTQEEDSAQDPDDDTADNAQSQDTFTSQDQESPKDSDKTMLPVETAAQDGAIEPIATPTPFLNTNPAGGVIQEAEPSAAVSSLPTPPVPGRPLPPATPQIPIMALSFAGSGGPKHCRGKMIQRLIFPQPAKQWINGTCINLSRQARCGTFYSNKDDNCEAQLFNMPDCLNTSLTYVNTVVFMPEERAIGSLWNSMFVRCGVEVPEVKGLDPALLGVSVKPGKKPGNV